jgi:membrane protein implicated in regulation of membrane protease activity
MFNAERLAVPITTALMLMMPDTAHAYIGPGAGLGAIAVTIALVLGILLLLAGLVWYPLKRYLRRKKPSERSETTGAG